MPQLHGFFDGVVSAGYALKTCRRLTRWLGACALDRWSAGIGRERRPGVSKTHTFISTCGFNKPMTLRPVRLARISRATVCWKYATLVRISWYPDISTTCSATPLSPYLHSTTSLRHTALLPAKVKTVGKGTRTAPSGEPIT